VKDLFPAKTIDRMLPCERFPAKTIDRMLPCERFPAKISEKRQNNYIFNSLIF
jgi:hypothetical protein